MMDLRDVTYLAIFANETDKIYQDIDSIIKIGQNSSRGLNFGRKIVYTFKEPTVDPKDFEIKMIQEIDFKDFNGQILKFYAEAFETKFMINFHSDGFIQNPYAWSNDFLNFDYIGAVNYYRGETLCGNGGFSLRSKNLCEKSYHLFEKNKSELEGLPEDVIVSYLLRSDLEENGFSFADLDTASKFSTEHYSTNSDYFQSSFGMHEIDSLSSRFLINHRKDLQLKLATR